MVESPPLQGGECQVSDLSVEKEISFHPPVEVTVDAPKNITVAIALDTWFRMADGTLINPIMATDDGEEADGDDGNEDGGEYDAELRGAHVIPAVQTSAEGDVEFRYDRSTGALRYKVELEDIEEITQVHVHVGDADTNGRVAVTLLQFTANVDGSGDGAPVTPEDDLEEAGTLIADDVVASDGVDGSLDALLGAMNDGAAYIDVHTVGHPDGEIRGQVQRDDD